MKLGTTMLSAFAVLLAVALPSWAQVKRSRNRPSPLRAR